MFRRMQGRIRQTQTNKYQSKLVDRWRGGEADRETEEQAEKQTVGEQTNSLSCRRRGAARAKLYCYMAFSVDTCLFYDKQLAQRLPQLNGLAQITFSSSPGMDVPQSVWMYHSRYGCTAFGRQAHKLTTDTHLQRMHRSQKPEQAFRLFPARFVRYSISICETAGMELNFLNTSPAFL